MNDGLALVSAFMAGLASSVGPCIAPRYLMLAAFVAQGRARTRALTFVAGCLGGYLVYAFAGAFIAILRVGTHVIYALLAAALIACGARALISREHVCRSGASEPVSFGATFLAGVTSSLMFSPCCTPIAIGFGLQAAEHGAGLAIAILLVFGLGHTLPLMITSVVASLRASHRVSSARDAWTTIGATLILAVGGLYAILA